MIWLRVALIAVAATIVVVALTQTKAKPVAEASPTMEPTALPTAAPTRVPLPTLAPQAVISRISRETPVPTAPPAAPAQPLVEVVDYGYSPAQLTIHLGESVLFVNDGNDGHDVTGTGPGGDWRSGPLAPSERYSRPFELEGAYTYVCTFHPEMRGRITVQP